MSVRAEPVEDAEERPTLDYRTGQWYYFSDGTKALGKTDADVAKACKFVGSEFVTFDGLSVAHLEKLLKELQRQMNKQTWKTQGEIDKAAKKKASKAKAEKPDNPTDEELPMDFASDIEKKLPEGSEDTVNAYLVKLKWIDKGQTFRDLSADKVKKVLGKFDNFLRVAGVGKEAA